MKKFLLPAGRPISRQRILDGKWEPFTTTRNAYYTVHDALTGYDHVLLADPNKEPNHHVWFRIPRPSEFSTIAVKRMYLVDVPNPLG
jgi:hypothetical protein